MLPEPANGASILTQADTSVVPPTRERRWNGGTSEVLRWYCGGTRGTDGRGGLAMRGETSTFETGLHIQQGPPGSSGNGLGDEPAGPTLKGSSATVSVRGARPRIKWLDILESPWICWGKIVKIVVVKQGAFSYLLPKAHWFWCGGKLVLPRKCIVINWLHNRHNKHKHRRNE
jgi:hypothetical protein